MTVFDPRYPRSISGWRIHPKDLDNFVKELRKLGHIIADPNLQLYRAKKFKEHTVQMVRSTMLDFKRLSELTQFVYGEHQPVWNTGDLVKKMGIKPVGKDAAEAGYWDSQGNMPGKKITVAGWVRALHTGFRIPLKGDKGERVKKWYYAVTEKNFRAETLAKGYLFVAPRPFMMKSYHDYVNSGLDMAVVDEYLNKLAKSR